MTRVLNFNPGPAVLPTVVLERVRDELLDYRKTGMSIMEHSHRGKHYEAVHQEAKSLLRELLAIPASHEILFMQGGASAQFALVPMNFLTQGASADYIVTGTWAKKALGEAKLLGNTKVAANTGKDGNFLRVPRPDELTLDPNAAYAHLTSNNTIAGTQYHTFPSLGSVPVVADMSSDLLWRPFDTSKFSLIYAGAQKNLGPSGVTIVILRKDWVEKARTDIPEIFRYKTHLDADSLHNTCPTFAIYMVREVLAWVKEIGGATAMEKRNREKATMLYGAIDAKPDFFRCPVERESRSVMNVVFRLPTEELEEKFINETSKAGMVGLKGHRSVGGIRVSMYNAMEPSGIRTLVDFMNAFAAKS